MLKDNLFGSQRSSLFLSLAIRPDPDAYSVPQGLRVGRLERFEMIHARMTKAKKPMLASIKISVSAYK